MKPERLLRALGQVDDQYIEAAAPGAEKKTNRRWSRWAAMAACFCVVIAAAVAVPELLQNSKNASDSAAEVAMESTWNLEHSEDTEGISDAMLSTTEESEASEAEITHETPDAEPGEAKPYPIRGFDEMLAEREQGTLMIMENVAMYTQVAVGERTANYEMVYGIDNEQLDAYIGTLYPNLEDGYHWYCPAGKTNLKYLIRECDGDGAQTLWVFRSFVVDDARANAYTYGDVCREIYGREDAAQIVSITASPSTANNTELGIRIQQEIGTTVYTERENIEKFHAVIQDVLCYGESDWEDYYAAENQYTYSFSTDDTDKLTSGEETYGTRYLTVTLEDGTTIDSWKYNALRGCFYEFGGIGTKALTAEQVSILNELFGIA